MAVLLAFFYVPHPPLLLNLPLRRSLNWVFRNPPEGHFLAIPFLFDVTDGGRPPVFPNSALFEDVFSLL